MIYILSTIILSVNILNGRKKTHHKGGRIIIEHDLRVKNYSLCLEIYQKELNEKDLSFIEHDLYFNCYQYICKYIKCQQKQHIGGLSFIKYELRV